MSPRTLLPPASAALFDCDGVVLDTEGLYSQFWSGIGTRFFPESPSFAKDIKGLTLTEIISRWFIGRPDDEAAARQALANFERGMAYEYIAGARELLETLRAQGVKTALVTSSDRAKMQRVDAARPELRSLFDCIVTAEDVRLCKPSPEAFLVAAERLGVDIAHCIVFEDSRNGLLAARRSGAYVVGLTTTNPIEVVAPLSDVQVADLREVASGSPSPPVTSDELGYAEGET